MKLTSPRTVRSVGSTRWTLLITLASLLNLVTGSAQTDTSNNGKKVESTDELLVLSPFEVTIERDVGYTAANALAGSRTDMPLKQTAAAISVMTRQFIDDVGATNFQQISDWGVNTMPTYSGNLAVNPFDYGINTRGPNSNSPSRDYFVWYVNSDSYATERYEYARGPNGVLFGDGNVGGIATMFTKQPIFGSPRYKAELRADSWGAHSVRADINQPLNDRLAFRLNVLYNQDEFWRDRTPFNNKGINLSGSYKLGVNTTLRASGEFGDGKRAVTILTYADQASYWDKTTSYLGTALPSSPSYGRMSSGVYNVFIPAIPQIGVSNWQNQYRSNGTGIAIRPDPRSEIQNFPVLSSREFNLQPRNSWQRLEFFTYNAYLEHRFSENLFGQIAYSHLWNEATERNPNGFNQYIIDINRYLPDGVTLNPKYGVGYSDNQAQKQVMSNLVDDVRAFVAYRVEKSWFKENLNAIIGSRADRFDLMQQTLYRTDGSNPNVTNASNQIRFRFYWDEPGAYEMPNEVPAFPGMQAAYVTSNESHQHKTIDYMQIASVTRLLHDNLTVFLGARRDGFRGTQMNGRADPVTGQWTPGNTLNVPGSVQPQFVYGAKIKQKFDPISKNGGVVYFVLPWLGLFANYSETFSTPSTGFTLIDGSVPGISKSRGRDYGVKISLGEGKLDARLNYYTTVQDDLLVNQLNRTQTDEIWNNIGRSEMTYQWRDTQSLKLNGWEFEMTANPTRNFRLTFNAALPEAKNVDSYPRYRKYLAENLPVVTAAIDTIALTNPGLATTLRNDIVQIQNGLQGLTTGTTLNNTYKYTSNIYGTYSFRSGWSKGLAIGLGANMRGKCKVATTAASASDYLYSDAYYVTSGHIGYETKIGNMKTKIQLNVYNILNNDELVTTGYSDYRVGGITTNATTRIPGAFRYLEPRKFALTTTFEF
ncbi:MAG: TonB-dependent receptor [Nibricoccus sp.]